MKLSNFKKHKYLAYFLSLVIVVSFFVIGKGEGHEVGLTVASMTVALTETEKADFSEPEQKMLLAVKKMVAGVEGKIKDGKLSADEVSAFKSGVIETLKNEELKVLKDELEEMDKKLKTQGSSLQDMELKLTTGGGIQKSIGAVLQENEAELKKVYQNGSGTKNFMVFQNAKGEWVMKPHDGTKATGPHATIAIGDVPASVSQSIDAASLLRLGGNSPIISQYRNNAWVFDLANVVNAGWDMPLAMWYEEQAKEGASGTVAEGGTKPKMQYSYALKSASYKKEAALIGFTDEFSLDFARLQGDIMNKGRIDVINRINSGILTNVTSNATAYNTAAEFTGGTPLVSANDYHVLAAMAAQVDNATFGALANTAVMSTFKKYNLGTVMSTLSGEWLDRPSVLDNLAFIGNPDMAADNVLVGDFKAYNIILRGGFIVKVGYNGNDFAENKFSVVMEQYYFDYISAIRKKAIVKGADFATVKTALTS